VYCAAPVCAAARTWLPYFLTLAAMMRISMSHQALCGGWGVSSEAIQLQERNVANLLMARFSKRLGVQYGRRQNRWGILVMQSERIYEDPHSPTQDTIWFFHDAPRFIKPKAVDALPELIEGLVAVRRRRLRNFWRRFLTRPASLVPLPNISTRRESRMPMQIFYLLFFMVVCILVAFLVTLRLRPESGARASAQLGRFGFSIETKDVSMARRRADPTGAAR
jgi:hypothetical protein